LGDPKSIEGTTIASSLATFLVISSLCLQRVSILASKLLYASFELADFSFRSLIFLISCVAVVLSQFFAFALVYLLLSSLICFL
jgi:hypothetical protein